MPKRPAPARCCDVPPGVKGLAKSDLARIVAVFRAFADPTRLEIFRLIAAQREPICVCDIKDRFHVGQPTISHHLKILREAGLLKVSRKGVWAHYAASAQGLAAARRDLSAVFGKPVLGKPVAGKRASRKA